VPNGPLRVSTRTTPLAGFGDVVARLPGAATAAPELEAPAELADPAPPALLHAVKRSATLAAPRTSNGRANMTLAEWSCAVMAEAVLSPAAAAPLVLAVRADIA
jgi:hypothetical protein